ncbi:unnamed protein product, partial [Mesorhabditis belari]|uniref:Uncharacterized protein n=1 Tax=Mesorhabditis belari TaxID=2138241 RepID=A0AAF3ENU0_9BILA
MVFGKLKFKLYVICSVAFTQRKRNFAIEVITEKENYDFYLSDETIFDDWRTVANVGRLSIVGHLNGFNTINLIRSCRSLKINLRSLTRQEESHMDELVEALFENYPFLPRMMNNKLYVYLIGKVEKREITSVPGVEFNFSFPQMMIRVFDIDFLDTLLSWKQSNLATDLTQSKKLSPISRRGSFDREATGVGLCAEPSGVRQFRFLSQCNKFCTVKPAQKPLYQLGLCCNRYNAGNWATCTKFNQAICARKDVSWSNDGNVECISYPFYGACATRYGLNNDGK